MKKILLLILTSLVLFACQKEDQQQEENGFGYVIHEYTCPNCGAKYSVMCRNPESGITISIVASGYNWILIDNPSWGDEWTVIDESGQIVSHYEYWDYSEMYFICTCGEKSKVFKKDDFKKQSPKK